MLKQESKAADLLHGSLWDKILLFVLPLALSNILQQFFNAADMAIVGHYRGDIALAAVGSNAAAINLLINTFSGLAVGANVVIARYIGIGNHEKVSKSVHAAMFAALTGGVLLAVIGASAARPLLILISTPTNVLNLATLYLRIYFIGTPFIMVYNFGAAILRSRGDTRRPFICLAIAGVINVLLNLLFVAKLGMGVEGVAAATVISNIFSSVSVFWFLLHDVGPTKVFPKKIVWDKDSLREIAIIGIPAGLQSMVFSISNIYVQSAINSLGSDVMAGNAAVLNFEWIVYYLINAFTQACMTFTSQNYGAGNYARCRRAIRLCLMYAFTLPTMLSVLFYLLGRPILGFYTEKRAVIDYGMIRMTYSVLPLCLDVLMDVLAGAIRGVGVSLAPTIIILIGTCGLRIVWVTCIFPHFEDFASLVTVYPVTWTVTSAAMLVAYLIVRKRRISSVNGQPAL